MKKLLVASTALVAFAAVSTAQAADPIKLSIGGYMQQYVGYSDNEDDNGAANYSEVGTYSVAEVYFRGSTKLDNGLTVGVNIDTFKSGGTALDAASDDTFLSVSSDSLGSVKVGSTKGVSFGLSTFHSDAGIGMTGSFSVDEFAQDVSGLGWGTALSTTDGHKVVYLTPNLGGVQAGVSYGLVNESNVGSANLQTAGNDIQYQAGIAYRGDLGGVAVSADYNYEMIEDGGLTGVGVASTATDGTATDSVDTISNPESHRVGLAVTVAGFKVAAGYRKTDNVGTVSDKDSDAWEAGVKYATGPYAVSLGYTKVEQDDDGTAAAQEDTSELWVASGSYNLGAGVTMIGSVINFDEDDASDNAANQTDEGSNWAVVAGLKVSF
ncbi:conserved exported hypothetical protein [Candidatus Terasakiella magnetica]|uniref:Porin domain-containing protein n=1 Tax=Candidatus Terasakiella magnetica TaxID=1867952 RepID=A0A1C3RGK0_9PROT|nr:porin [Candidatus Terasakiella magnetica]SCA56368.1 conserved exported hypothetical protein [Candidatus Terasakiella magnetica]